jgi:hypothetical protein
MSRQKMTAVLGTLAIVGAGSASAAIANSSGQAAHGKVLGQRHTHAVHGPVAASTPGRRVRVSRSLTAHFHAFSGTRARAASAADINAVSAGLAPLAALGRTYGADASQATGTTVGPAGVKVWIVPGTTGACLVDVEGPQGAGSDCLRSAAVLAGHLWTVDAVHYAGSAPQETLIGVAPDGYSSATVNWSDGTTSTLPVTANIYSTPIGAHAGWKSVTLTGATAAALDVTGMAKLP